MLVEIKDIKVKKRIRKNLGDVGAMAESLKRFGQICPIIITKENVLVAGERRLEAARSLGWSSINAIVADISDDIARLEYELEENVQRRDFSIEEEEEAAKRIANLRNPSLFRRIINALKRIFHLQ